MRSYLAAPLIAVALVVAFPATAATPTAAHVHGYGHVAGRSVQVPPRGFTGGPITTTNTGETFTVFVADTYLTGDPAIAQRFADMVGGFVHGRELADLILYVAPIDRIRRMCGAGSLACYDSDAQTIVTVGTDAGRVPAISILLHEYGHHIANNRANPPWDAIDYGTKRWASYVNVCSRSEDGELVPGDEDEDYEVNPGEAYAEAYRVLGERRAGLPETSWDIVDRALYPDDEQLRLLEQDILEPWQSNTSTTVKARFVKGDGGGRVFGVTTQLDGMLRLTLKSALNTSFELRVRDAKTGEVLAVAPGGKRVKTLGFQVCGERDVFVGVRRVIGYGAFVLTISKP